MTAVEWLIKEIEEKHNFRFGNFYWAEIQQAKEMEEEQMCNHISFGAGLKKSMEEKVYEDIKNGLEELVKQGKLKDYRNYKSE
jgi:hypothetical protein